MIHFQLADEAHVNSTRHNLDGKILWCTKIFGTSSRICNVRDACLILLGLAMLGLENSICNHL